MRALGVPKDALSAGHPFPFPDWDLRNLQVALAPNKACRASPPGQTPPFKADPGEALPPSDDRAWRHRARSWGRGHSGGGAILSQVALLPPKEPDMIEDLSDEELLAEWEKTKARRSSARFAVSNHELQRHMAAEAELKRRGFGENPPGYWTRMPM